MVVILVRETERLKDVDHLQAVEKRAAGPDRFVVAALPVLVCVKHTAIRFSLRLALGAPRIVFHRPASPASSCRLRASSRYAKFWGPATSCATKLCGAARNVISIAARISALPGILASASTPATSSSWPS